MPPPPPWRVTPSMSNQIWTTICPVLHYHYLSSEPLIRNYSTRNTIFNPNHEVWWRLRRQMLFSNLMWSPRGITTMALVCISTATISSYSVFSFLTERQDCKLFCKKGVQLPRGWEMYTKYVIYSCSLFMRGGSNMSVFEFLNHGICFVTDDFPTWSGSSVSFQYQSLCFFGRTAGYKLLESMTIMSPSQLKQKTSQLWYINLSKIPGEH